jgi:chromosome segregation ATPase
MSCGSDTCVLTCCCLNQVYYLGVDEVKRRNILGANLRREIRAINSAIMKMTLEEDNERSAFLAANGRLLSKDLFPGINATLPRIVCSGSLDIDTELPVIVDEPIPENAVLAPMIREALAIEAVRSDTSASAEQVAAANQRVHELELSNGTLQHSNEELRARITALESTLAEKSAQMTQQEQQSSADKAVAQQQIASMQATITKTASESEMQRSTTLAEFDAKMARLLADKDEQLASSRRDFEQQLAASKRDFEKQLADFALNKQSELSQATGSLTAQLQAKEADLAKLTSDLTQLTARMTDKLAEIQTLGSRLADAQLCNDRLSSEHQSLTTQLTDRTVEVDRLRTANNDLERKLAEQATIMISQPNLAGSFNSSSTSSSNVSVTSLTKQLAEATNNLIESDQIVMTLTTRISELENELQHCKRAREQEARELRDRNELALAQCATSVSEKDAAIRQLTDEVCRSMHACWGASCYSTRTLLIGCMTTCFAPINQ